MREMMKNGKKGADGGNLEVYILRHSGILLA